MTVQADALQLDGGVVVALLGLLAKGVRFAVLQARTANFDATAVEEPVGNRFPKHCGFAGCCRRLLREEKALEQVGSRHGRARDGVHERQGG